MSISGQNVFTFSAYLAIFALTLITPVSPAMPHAILTREQLAKDFYKVLGLIKTANATDVKRAYRQLAMQWHPDKHLNNKEAAEAKFKVITEAHEVLSDETKRAYYDRYRGTAGVTASEVESEFDPVKYAVIALPIYLTMFMTFLYLLFDTLDSIYVNAVKNPKLARKVYKRVLNSFQTMNITSAEMPELLAKNISSYQYSYSSMCNWMARGGYNGYTADLDLSSCAGFNKKEVNLTSATGELALPLPVFEIGEIPSNFAIYSTLALIYVATRSFHIFKNRENFWSSDMDNRQKLERIVLMLAAAGLILSGVDALTDCFGIMNMLAEDAGVIATSCVRACNDGHYKNGVLINVNGQQEIFSLPREPKAVADAYLAYKKLAAGMANTLVVPVTLLITKFSAIYFRNNANRDDEPRQENGHGHRHHR